MKFILSLFFLILTHSAIYSKISTQYGNSLTQNDFLLSTLGYFRMTLNSQTCQLKIQNFTNNNYIIAGYYPRLALSPCQSLSISGNSFVSNNNDTILSLQSSQIKSFYDQVFVTIDEMAIIRINGVYNKRYQSSQNWISIFRTPRQYVYSISNLNVTIYSSLSFIRNNGNWGFSATNGQLRLFKVDDVSKIIRYNYTGFTITPNNLFDYNSNSLPLANYNEFRYQPTCSSGGYFQSFQGPFTFIINPYWPQIRLIDRKGYEIIALRYPNPSCYNIIGDYLRDTDSCMNWFCPVNTFQHNGNCLSECPSPFFHQIGKNGVNRCVINCPSNYIKDNLSRVCACGSIPTYNCPSTLRSTPFGCLCSVGSFFNPYNQEINNSSTYCYSSCGPFLFAHKDGICVPCPRDCEICTLSQNSFSYLMCSVCVSGFTINSQGFCIKNCQIANSTSTNDNCVTCIINNCNNCSKDNNICFSCFKPFSLFNNLCISTCPSGFKSSYDQNIGFTCALIPGCTIQSTLVNDINNQSSCFCTRNGNLAYAKTCGGKQIKTCRNDYYFDSNTFECLACPIGCLSCVLDNYTKIECTSCRPDYSLFITISKNHYCERNSIISVCPNNYDFVLQLCSISNINQIVMNMKSRNACFVQVNNCSICVSGSTSLCSLCNDQFYLYQGICYQNCPNGTMAYSYQKVCIQIQNTNCLIEKTQRAYYLFTKTFFNQYSDGYLYLISVNFQGPDYLNDPLGSIFIFFKGPGIQSMKKMVNIATSYQKCMKCKTGYGLNEKGQCVKCILPCLQCTFVSNLSQFCLKCSPQYRLNKNNQCEQLKLTQLPCKFGEYRNESQICQRDCLAFTRHNNYLASDRNKSFQINCTANCPDNFAIQTYLIENSELRLKCQKSSGEEQSQSITFLGNKIALHSSAIYMLISTNQLIYKAQTPINIQIVISSNQRILLNENRTVKSFKIPFGFILVDNTADLSSSSIIAKLPAALITSNSKGKDIFLSNSVYGFDANSKSFIDIIYDKTSNLYFYGRAYVVISWLLTILFLSQGVNYKTDNMFISFAILYLILPSINLQNSGSCFNSYSFLYGFAWSTHLQLFSNPRFLTTYTSWFQNYIDKSNNNAHYLLFIDNNIVRNCWSLILVFLTVCGTLFFIIFIMKCFAVKDVKIVETDPKNCCWPLLTRWTKIGYNNKDFNHIQRISKMATFFAQNSIIAIAYYGILNLLNQSWDLAPSSKLITFKVIAAIFYCLTAIYICLRFYVDKIGGIYCLKRFSLGTLIGVISYLGGVDQNIALSLIFLIVVEVIFIILRYKYEFISDYLSSLVGSKKRTLESPKLKIKSRQTLAYKPRIEESQTITNKQQTSSPQASQFWIMVIQQLLIIIMYVFAILINQLKQVSVLIVWIIVTIFMVNFLLQFVDLIVNYWSKTYNRMNEKNKPFYKKIRNNWDHEVSLKSLPSTTY